MRLVGHLKRKHSTNSYEIGRAWIQYGRSYLDENKGANVRRDIFRNNRLKACEIIAIKRVAENDLNIRQEENEESVEKSCPTRVLIEKLSYDLITQKPEEIRNYDEPDKNSKLVKK